jgi:phosphoglucosamine mutase
MPRLFGTDGIRGRANVDLTPELALALGRAVARRLTSPGQRVVVGRDTRRSGEMLTASLAAGLTTGGVDAIDAGVITTPGLAFVAGKGGYAAGVMISASHNPADDNGLKVFVGGRKADEVLELELEALIADPGAVVPLPNERLGRTRRAEDAAAGYRAHLAAAANGSLAGLRIGIDCANGSAGAVAPALFTELGATVEVIGNAPDGANINLDCGSTHPEFLAAMVSERHLSLGLAFDGDADRLIAVDDRGRVVDGDAIMGICAIHRAQAGTLRNNLVVTTVMSNGGLERALATAGVRMLRTPVGDRHVLAAMEEADAVLGGEQSGHIIFRDRTSTGDGMLTAIELLNTVQDAGGASLAELVDQIPRLPQVMLNSAVRRRDAWRDDPVFAAAVATAEEQLAGRGRILVRPSGTEPLIRIMVEGDAEEEIGAIARELQRLAETRLS